MNDGDWICTDANCGNINFARRSSCYRCNKEKPDQGKVSKKKLGTEIGKSAAEKSRGLFNADDWQCNKCANVNWARRSTCNVCNAPKFGEVEARTGYGGGYNERGVVEYRRRDSSSSDEYDEFGRKKRKTRRSDSQKSDAQDKVGTTEGPVFKMLPPMLLRESKMDQMSESAPNPRPTEKVSGSLSDGSVCDYPPLSKMAFRKYQIQNQTSYHRQDHMLPRNNGFQTRKRYSSTGDREQTGSSGYETMGKRDSTVSPIAKTYDPVMENRVSSTNNDVVYKFTGSNPAESFEVTYSLEERVKAAAMAIVYSNLKLSSRKFENIYDKPAPDFKTIFAWRTRLLSTGCLVDSHVDVRKEALVKPSPYIPEKKDSSPVSPKPPIQKLPNPDEIPISVSSDEEDEDDIQAQNKLQASRQRSISAETLLISGVENNTRKEGSVVSTADEQTSQARTHSRSTHRRDRSSSSDSRASDYPDTDSDEKNSKTNNDKPTVKSNTSVKQSVQDSDSESVSYNSEEDDFLSRVYKGKKQKRKTKRRSNPVTPVKPPTPVKQPTYVSANQSFPGYSTMKPTEISPLATGNIYAPNLRNMMAKNKENNLTDMETGSTEYVPTKLGYNTQNNYQKFKDNVRKKGFWAKANGQSMTNNRTNGRNNQFKNANVRSFWSIGNQYMPNKRQSSVTIIPGLQNENLSSTVNDKMYNIQNVKDTKIPQKQIDLFWSQPGQPFNNKSITAETTIPGMQDHSDKDKPNFWTKDVPDSNNTWAKTDEENTRKRKLHKKTDNIDLFGHDSDDKLTTINHTTTNLPGLCDAPVSDNFWAKVEEKPSKKRKLTVDLEMQNMNTDSPKSKRSSDMDIVDTSESNKSNNFGSKVPEEPQTTIKNAGTHAFWPNTGKSNNTDDNCMSSNLPGIQNSSVDKHRIKDAKQTLKQSKNTVLNSMDVPPCIDPYTNKNQGYISVQPSAGDNNDDEFTKDDFKNYVVADPYRSFDKISAPTIERLEDTSCVFDIVQSNNTSKNKSILDIFDTQGQSEKSSELNNEIEKSNSIRKYETEWDDDDEALYGNDTEESTKKRTPSPPSIASIRAQSPLTMMPENQAVDMKEQNTSTPRKITMDVIRDRRDKLLDTLKNFQATREQDLSNIPIPPTSPLNKFVQSSNRNISKQTIQNNLMNKPQDMPSQISNEIIGLAEENIKSLKKHVTKTINPAKRVHVLESITIKPNDNIVVTRDEEDLYGQQAPDQTNHNQQFIDPKLPQQNNNITQINNMKEDEDGENLYNEPHETKSHQQFIKSKESEDNNTPQINGAIHPVILSESPAKPAQPPQNVVPQIDFSSLLSGINANTLMLALQNLQQISQNPMPDTSRTEEQGNNQINDDNQETVETINLTNDEDWEKDSNNEDNSIEQQLARMDGNIGDTPFLGDIFDPGPVVMPPHLANKLNININIKKPEEKTETPPPHINENAPVIGNFKSFALPKPILLNKLRVTMKVPDKPEGPKTKKKNKPSASKNEEEEEEEESGDEADLSKYDLIGSDEEQGTSKTDAEKDGEGSKEGVKDKNGKRDSPENKSRNRRSSSSSSSTSSSSSSSSQTSEPKNKFDDFNLNSEREGTPRGRKTRSRSRSPHARPGGTRRKSRDSRSAGETRNSRDKDYRRDKSREKSRDKSSRDGRKERRYSRDGKPYTARSRHR